MWVRIGAGQGNNLACLEGMEMLTSLEQLDLRGNLVASFREVVRISGGWHVVFALHRCIKPV